MIRNLIYLLILALLSEKINAAEEAIDSTTGMSSQDNATDVSILPFDLENKLKLVPLTNSINNFGLEFTRVLLEQNKGKNVASSPFSVVTLFSMLLSSAGGQTYAEMIKTFSYTNLLESNLDINQAFRNLLTPYKELEEGNLQRDLVLNVPSMALYSNDFKIKKSFRANLLNNYFTTAVKGNFSLNSKEITDQINSWVSAKTRETIPKLLDEPLSVDTKLALINAVYFKGEWVDEFERRLFFSRNFKNSDKSISKVDMMFRRALYNYLNEPKFCQIIEIPYKGNASMYILLPHPSQNLASFLKNLTPSKLDTLLMQMSKNSVELFLPKFKLELSLDLKKPLQVIGLETPFTFSANFTGISSTKMFVSDAKQKVFVDVNEKGTVAAAASLAGVVIKSGTYSQRMEVDRPFIFIIKDTLNDLNLFMGVVQKL